MTPESRAHSVLYISYNGLTEPLGRRQVIPYLVRLARRGWRFSVVSFEKRETADEGARRSVAELLLTEGIHWLPRRYHSKPSLPATAFDISQGWLAGASVSAGPALVHARSTVAAVMASGVSRLRGVPWIFDVRGLVAEEYVDAGHWKRGGLLYRLTDRVERRLMTNADGIVLLTRRIRDYLGRRAGLAPTETLEIVPCCVDTGEFRPSSEARREVRRELGMGDDPVLVYLGSLGSWYRLEEMLDFHVVARSIVRGLKLWILTPHQDAANAAVARRPHIASSVMVGRAAADGVPRLLAAADAGLCFLGDCLSKWASSPTKYGEYLASGLPVITNRWTGDAAALSGERCWIAIDSFSDGEYSRAGERLAELLTDPDDTRTRARALALREFNLETATDRYEALYRKVLARCPRSA